MKRTLSLFLALLVALALCACGGPAVKDGVFTTTVSEFSQKLEDVVAKNSDLAGISLSEMGSDSGTANSFRVYDGNDFIGSYLVGVDEKGNIKGVSVIIIIDGPPAEKIEKMSTAAWMTLDRNLSYEEAHNGITKTLMDGIIWGSGDSIEKNGVSYRSQSLTDSAIFLATPAG